MDETRRLVDALKGTLRSRGFSYRWLAGRVGLSEASVKRIFSTRSLTLRRLEQMCAVLDTSIAEVARLADDRPSQPTQLTAEQEHALAADGALLTYLYLLLSGWSDAEVQRQYQFEPADIQRLRLRLADLGLLDSPAGKRPRLRVTRQIIWRPEGPVRRAYARQVKTEFLDGGFQGGDEFLAWQLGELTDPSRKVLRRKLEAVYRDMLELAELDASSTQPRRNTGMLVALRPWVFSLVAKRRRSQSS